MDLDHYRTEIELLMIKNSVKFCVYGFKLDFNLNPLMFTDAYSCIYFKNYDDLVYYCNFVFCDYCVSTIYCIEAFEDHFKYGELTYNFSGECE